MRADSATSLAVGMSGILAGCLTFVSFVEARTILKLVDAGTDGVEMVRKFFPIWWPYGRDLMVPVILLTTGAHGLAFSITRELAWLCTAGISLSIAPYTAFVLGEDIAQLRRAETKEVSTIARSFCRWHHPRLAIAGGGLAMALHTAFRSH
eukprot:TRINITY_DN99893_c0_g1_i1.p1 TRINITY_DN99893_c0_g1~~TRINITY_DN99893_c0_g1_i1.p1  ORF type:complete len:151 (-),score=21.14 TRINITY_DN99893_c0_g1_i1:152-604(-)